MKQAFSKKQIEQSLRSAVGALTPDLSGKIDLSAPQIRVQAESQPQSRILRLERRMQGIGLAAAACLCLFLAGGGAWYYQRQNLQVESVIGIDVNPSVELFINRKEKVLKAQALNADADAIMEDMDLKGVDLKVAVNAVVGSMVTHGYLDELDNAILVTVTNDSVSKAKALRASVVQDIEETLQENEVAAVVYDQQVVEDEEISALADQYGISYGKAYFLKELIDQNPGLDMEDMETLSGMTMEEIAARITQSSLALGELADQNMELKETAFGEPEEETLPLKTEETSPADPESSEENGEEEASIAQTEAESTESRSESTAAETSPVTEPETEEEPYPVREDQVEIDFVDYEDGEILVYFVTRVHWKNPTVAVRDEEGNSYAAMVDDTSGSECTIAAPGLNPGRSYTFVLGGLIPVETGIATTVKGYFETPQIAAGAKTEEADEDEDAEEAADEDEDAEEAADEDEDAEKAADEDEDAEKAADKDTAADETEADEIKANETEVNGNGPETKGALPDAAEPEPSGDAGRELEAGKGKDWEQENY